MNIFNSLGSNYNFDFVVKALFAKGNKETCQKLVDLLEKKYQGKAVLTYKGRQAIEVGLKSLNLEKGSSVAICGYTCFAVYQAIKNADLEVEYLDLPDSKSLNFSVETLTKALSKNPKIKVVIIQNTLGVPCQIEKIQKICQDKKIILFEDLAHSVGTVYDNGEEAGTIGDFVALSFSQDKIIDAISGGALVIRSSKYQIPNYKTFKKIGFWQQFKDRFYPRLTYRIRIAYPFYIGKVAHLILKKIGLLSVPMNDQTSSGINKLPSWYTGLTLDRFDNLAENLNHRKKIANIFAKNLDKKVLSDDVIKNIERSTNLRFPIFLPNRNQLIEALKNQGVYVSDIWYDAPIAPKKYLAKSDYKGNCPISEEISKLMLNLPTHINVSEKDALKICSIINQEIK